MSAKNKSSSGVQIGYGLTVGTDEFGEPKITVFDVQTAEEDARAINAAKDLMTHASTLRLARVQSQPPAAVLTQTAVQINSSKLKLSDVVSEYLEARRRGEIELSEKAGDGLEMLGKLEPALSMFLKVVGDKAVSEVFPRDISGFFRIVQSLPPRWSDKQRQTGKSIRELAAMSWPKCIAKKTFEGNYVGMLRPFLAWAIRNYMREGFPADLSTVDIGYGGDRKEPEGNQRGFRADELKRLFNGPEYTAFAADPAQHSHYWLPLIGLYTGARVNEVCQLNPQCDIRQDPKTGIWFFDITAKSEAAEGVKKSVKGKKYRTVPIHSKLIDLGLLAYVERMQKQGKKLVFPEFSPSKGRAAGEAEKWFRKHVAAVGLRDDTAGAKLAGFHAFRHTFGELGKIVEPLHWGEITGHTNKFETAVQSGYSGKAPLWLKKEVIERFVFDIDPPRPTLTNTPPSS